MGKNCFLENALKSWSYTIYKIVLKTEQINTFSYIVGKLKGIFKFGHMYAACLFFSLWLLNFSVPALKNFSQNHIEHGLTYQSFLHYIFI